MPMVANNVEFMDGPCEGDRAVKAPVAIIGGGDRIITHWKGRELYRYELREINKAYWVNIIEGTD